MASLCDSLCQCLLVLSESFSWVSPRRRNYRLMGNMQLLLFPRLPHCPPFCARTLVSSLPHLWDPRALLTQVLPGCLGLSQPCGRRTQSVESYFISPWGLPGPAFRAAPPGSAVLTVRLWARCWVSLSWGTLVLKQGMAVMVRNQSRLALPPRV